jgi:hypothetical protein
LLFLLVNFIFFVNILLLISIKNRFLIFRIQLFILSFQACLDIKSFILYFRLSKEIRMHCLIHFFIISSFKILFICYISIRLMIHCLRLASLLNFIDQQSFSLLILWRLIIKNFQHVIFLIIIHSFISSIHIFICRFYIFKMTNS